MCICQLQRDMNKKDYARVHVFIRSCLTSEIRLLSQYIVISPNFGSFESCRGCRGKFQIFRRRWLGKNMSFCLSRSLKISSIQQSLEIWQHLWLDTAPQGHRSCMLLRHLIEFDSKCIQRLYQDCSGATPGCMKLPRLIIQDLRRKLSFFTQKTT